MNRRSRPSRRGTTAVLAMMYLILFSMLALGFFAANTTAVQVTANDDRVARALLAAESGMEYMRFVLADTPAPAGKTGAALLGDVKTALAAKLEPTTNMSGRTLGWDGSSRITIPDITLGTNLKFGAKVELDGTGSKLVVTTTGVSGNLTIASRAVTMTFPSNPGSAAIFNYGVASKSSVSMHNNSSITGVSDDSHGAILIAATVNPDLVMDNHAVISGDVNLVDPTGTIDQASNADIDGAINLGADEPEFPTINTSAFATYATTVLTEANKKYKNATLKNIRIAANTNPTFDSGVKMTGVETLPATSDFPAALRAMTGSLILAPTFLVHMHTSAGVEGGSIVAGQVEMHSNAIVTITGSIISLNDSGFTMHSNAQVHIQRPAAGYAPAGMTFSGRFTPDVTTYVED